MTMRAAPSTTSSSGTAATASSSRPSCWRRGVTWDALRREIRDQILAQPRPRPPRRPTIHDHRRRKSTSISRRTGTSSKPGLKYHAFHTAITVEAPRLRGGLGSGQARRSTPSRSPCAGRADFAELARTRAKDPAGGDLGWLARGELDEALEKPLLRAPEGPGDRTPSGPRSAYHLLQLADRERA